MSESHPSRPAPDRTVRRALTTLPLAILLAILGVAAAMSAVLLGGSPALAQDANSLQSITPADGAELDVSPTEIVLSFNQELRSTDRPIVNMSCNTLPQNVGAPTVDAEGLVVTSPINTPVPKGICIISWSLTDADNVTLAGPVSSTFRVNNDTVATTLAPGAAGTATTLSPFVTVPNQANATESTTPNQGSNGGALWLGRLLSTIGIMALFGGLALIAIGWPEGPEYVVTVRYLRAVWVLALVGTVLFLIAYAAKFNDTSFGSALSPTAWLDLKDDGWPGRAALLRLAFVAASGWVAMRPERIIDPTTAMWAWGIPGAALITVAMTRVEGPWPWLGVLIGIGHVFSAAIWFGGVAIVARVVLAGPGEEDLLHATRAFSRMSTKAMVAVVVTGILQMVRLVGNPFASSHGQVLLLKVVAVAAMVAVGLEARRQVAVRLDRAHEMTVPLADRFRRAFGAEAAIGVVVLAFSGWMLALTPAKVDPLGNEHYTLEMPFNDPATGVQALVRIGPGTVGPNGFRMEVEAPPEGIQQLVLRFIPPLGSNANVLEQPIPLSGAGTAVLREANGLPLDTAGEWTLELVATTSSGSQPGQAVNFIIAAADGAIVTTPTGTQPPSSVVVNQVTIPTTPAAFVTTLAPTLPPSTTVP